LSPTSSEVEVPGGSLALFELSDPASAGPPVIAVHGITGNSHSWLAVARALGRRGRLLAIDLRGRGRSSGLAGPYGLDAHGEDLIAVMDHAGIERCVFTGHSLGAYIVARLSANHPDRITAAVLVDGGLLIPGSRDADSQAFLEAFLGPTLARLRMRFASRGEYHAWWRAHPAIAGTDVAPEDLTGFADHDLTGEAPQLRSSVAEEAVSADAADLTVHPEPAMDMTIPADFLCAPLGLQGQPAPMQPLETVETWAAADRARRTATQVAGVNHYTITLGTSGAQRVADAIARQSALAA